MSIFCSSVYNPSDLRSLTASIILWASDLPSMASSTPGSSFLWFPGAPADDDSAAGAAMPELLGVTFEAVTAVELEPELLEGFEFSVPMVRYYMIRLQGFYSC